MKKLVVFVFFAVVGCNSEDAAPLIANPLCEQTLDCPLTMVCNTDLGQCVDFEIICDAGNEPKYDTPDGNPICTSNVDCKTDNDCIEEGYVCMSNKCTQYSISNCEDDSDCYNGYICQAVSESLQICVQDISGQTTEPDPEPTDQTCDETTYCRVGEVCGPQGICITPNCMTDEECGYGTVCQNYECVSESSSAFCSVSSECDPGNICEQGRCVEGCFFDGNCPANFTCDQGLGKCVENNSTAPTGCTADDECGEGYICEDTAQVCVVGCRADEDCGEGFSCTDSACVEERVEEPDPNTDPLACELTNDCELGFICVRQVCQAGCYSQFDCPSGYACDAGQCVENGENTSCLFDSHCAEGKICSEEGFCIPGCRDNSGCEEGRICDNLKCITPDCVADEDCGVGYFCYNYQCFLDPEFICGSNDDCADDEYCSENQCHSVNTGDECRTDTDCNSSNNEWCQDFECVVIRDEPERSIFIFEHPTYLEIIIRGSLSMGLQQNLAPSEISSVHLGSNQYGWPEEVGDKFTIPYSGDDREYIITYNIVGYEFRGTPYVRTKAGNIVYFDLRAWTSPEIISDGGSGLIMYYDF